MKTLEEKKPPRFHALRRFFFHNFLLKLLAFALAVVIYLTLRSGVSVKTIEQFNGDSEEPKYDLKDKLANADR